MHYHGVTRLAFGFVESRIGWEVSALNLSFTPLGNWFAHACCSVTGNASLLMLVTLHIGLIGWLDGPHCILVAPAPIRNTSANQQFPMFF
ncbi:MAG: hypothetical protein ACKPKO_11010, partial [Candidatus Fonsibacter sp.]